MIPPKGVPSFAQYRTVGEAANFLGVSTATLRNWDRSGKLKPRRHPQNGYRIYLHEDLEAILKSADQSLLPADSIAPHVDWATLKDSEHFVQFYESDDFLTDSVSQFVAAALSHDNASIVIATAEHRNAIQRKLAVRGMDLSEAIESGRYIVLDAGEALSKFMVNGSPDPQCFAETLGETIAKLADGGRRVHAFGEMVALLWADGNREAAVRLEELWNALGKIHRFALFCAYPLDGFANGSDALPFDAICKCHSRVVPSESYAAVVDPDERLRAVAQLQQKAQMLEAEIFHRIEVEKGLTKREQELTDLFENATEGIHKVAADGTIIWANRAECRMLGYTVEEVVGRSITEFHADAETIAEILHRLKCGESLESFPARLRCKHGSIKHVLINSNACFENGEFAYTRCFTRDVTRQWESEQALRDAARRKDEFLATLAHELRNPLAPIRNGLELLKLNGTDEKLANNAREIMERQVNQLMRLVDDLLDVSRISRGTIELRREHVELADIIASAVETSRPLIDSAGHSLAVTLPKKPLVLDVDPTRMAQVFSNLLNNSAKYTQPAGRIDIEVQEREHSVVIVVRDNGMGISCEELAHVFDMFRQADRSLERAQGGLGIGLTLVRRLVELHGGKIDAQSEGLGKGSEFVVQLPLAGDVHQLQAVKTTRPGGLSKQRILVVDDNEDSAATLSTLLRLNANDVRTACDGLEAIEIASKFLPEIILMDVGMPNLNGYEATRRIRETEWGKDAFIVALSGWGQIEDMQRSTEAGCSAHLTKPVDFAELEQLLINQTTAKN